VKDFGTYEIHFPSHEDEHDDEPFVKASDYEELLQAYERLTIMAKAMIAICGDGSFVNGGSLRRGAKQLADALK
jgi:hypothetical protein